VKFEAKHRRSISPFGFSHGGRDRTAKNSQIRDGGSPWQLQRRGLSPEGYGYVLRAYLSANGFSV